MNKKNNRKGFTIVELVIVIAVIAILATVLVPTFGEIINKANDSKVLQELKNEYTTYTIEAGVEYKDSIYILMGGNYYKIEKGAPSTAVVESSVVAADTDAVIFDAANDVVVHTYVDANADDKCDSCGLATAGTAHK